MDLYFEYIRILLRITPLKTRSRTGNVEWPVLKVKRFSGQTARNDWCQHASAFAVPADPSAAKTDIHSTRLLSASSVLTVPSTATLSTWVYIMVVLTSEWPNSSYRMRISARLQQVRGK